MNKNLSKYDRQRSNALERTTTGEDMDFGTEFEALLETVKPDYTILGILTSEAKIYPLGSDTKVLSTVFEAMTRPLVYRIAAAHGLDVWEPQVQNSYPDFTLLRGPGDGRKIAVDVKTTYAQEQGERVKFTLGSYTSFLRDGTKNIEFPHEEYTKHWIVGYVYRRTAHDDRKHVYTLDDQREIPPPYAEVEVFVQEKWRMAGDVAGSGNTANIGSVRATVADFREGPGVFRSEAEYVHYWQNYARTAAERADTYGNVGEYRRWVKSADMRTGRDR